MKIVASSAFLLLMISIVSFGMPTFANAQSTEFPLTVSTDYPGYAENGEIIISGKVKVLIDSTFPLEEASKAHALMDSSQHIGKILLTTAHLE